MYQLAAFGWFETLVSVPHYNVFFFFISDTVVISLF